MLHEPILARIPPLYYTHTPSSSLLLLSPSLSVPCSPPLSSSALCLPCLSDRYSSVYRRLGYPPPGPPPLHESQPPSYPRGSGSNHGNHRYFHQVHRRVPAVRGAREVSKAKAKAVATLFIHCASCLSCRFCPPPPQPRLTLFSS